MPTGTGKTEVALAAMAQTGVATLVVAPIRDLMYQWHRRILKGLGYDAGIVGDNTFNLRPVTVTTYDSACIHMQDFGDEFQFAVPAQSCRVIAVRAAEGRPLLLVVREAPLHPGHLRLMSLATEAGAVIFPPVPAFYARPQSVDEIVDNIVGRVLARLGIDNDLYTSWVGMEKPD